MMIILTKILLFLVIRNSWYCDKRIVKVVALDKYLDATQRLGKLSVLAKLLDFIFICLLGYVIYRMNLDFLF